MQTLKTSLLVAIVSSLILIIVSVVLLYISDSYTLFITGILFVGFLTFIFSLLSYVIFQQIFVQHIAKLYSLIKTVRERFAVNLPTQIPSYNTNQVDEYIAYLEEIAAALNTTKDVGQTTTVTDDDLNAKLKMIEEEKKSLEDNKKAMINILEDLNNEKTKLATAKAKDEALLASIGEGIIAADETGKIVVINGAALSMINVKKEDVIGHTVEEVHDAEDDKGVPITPAHRPMNIALTAGKTTNTTYYIIRKDKTKFPVFITSSPVILANKIVGAIVVFRDITKEKEIDRMKTEFISLASHQLRTPLSAIKWFGEMLLNGDAGELKPEQLEMITNISQSNDRMIALVNSLLNISRIESGRIIIDPEPTDLKKLVEDVLVDVKAKVAEKGHHMVVSVHGELPLINIDPKLVRHVYMNLLTNAIKYTPKGGEISIFISKKDNEVISQVSDNGYGIPKSQQDKVFQKFFRAENIIKVETDGTGLGLYLVKSIVESSGGKIRFESEENKGTTWWISFPLSGSKAKKGEVTIDS